jgi:hypothetical protein
MPVKPSDAEEEYFARQELELRKKIAAEHQAKMQAEERERERALHFMKCPKCGMELQELSLGGVHVDKCCNCGGLWLDKGEMEAIQAKEPGFMNRLLGVFRS